MCHHPPINDPSLSRIRSNEFSFEFFDPPINDTPIKDTPWGFGGGVSWVSFMGGMRFSKDLNLSLASAIGTPVLLLGGGTLQ